MASYQFLKKLSIAKELPPAVCACPLCQLVGVALTSGWCAYWPMTCWYTSRRRTCSASSTLLFCSTCSSREVLARRAALSVSRCSPSVVIAFCRADCVEYSPARRTLIFGRAQERTDRLHTGENTRAHPGTCLHPDPQLLLPGRQLPAPNALLRWLHVTPLLFAHILQGSRAAPASRTTSDLLPGH